VVCDGPEWAINMATAVLITFPESLSLLVRKCTTPHHSPLRRCVCCIKKIYNMKKLVLCNGVITASSHRLYHTTNFPVRPSSATAQVRMPRTASTTHFQNSTFSQHTRMLLAQKPDVGKFPLANVRLDSVSFNQFVNSL
jgi:hypothetical protein